MALQLTSMLKTLGNIESTTWSGEGVVGVGSDSKAGREGNKLDRSEIDDGEIDGSGVEVGKKD